jgi:tetratricopeptide (TPR) repeat protein
MQLKEIFIISKGTKVILAITLSVSLAAILFASFYYRSVNSSEDPRIAGARELMQEFDRASGSLKSIEAFPSLDSAAALFRSIPDYECSFEIGVIYNNKSSALLFMAIYDSTAGANEKSNLLDLSMKYSDSSIMCYTRWREEWGDLSPFEIGEKLRPMMHKDDPAFSRVNFEKVFERRTKNIIAARIETDRRLSVSLTNKGTIYRHMQKQDSALVYYREALELWKDNRTANSNLSVLMGGEPVKPSFIETLFPPDKNKK